METRYLEKEKHCAIMAAREAGAIIRAVYNTNYTIDYKDTHNSPVTIADRDANQKIHKILQFLIMVGFPKRR